MQMGLQNRDKLSSLFLILFSVLVCTGSSGYAIGSLRKPGPGFFPFIGGLILGILSLSHFLLLTARRKKGTERGESVTPGGKWSNIILPLVVLFAYPLLLSVIGFVLTTFLFFVVLLRCVEPVRWPTALKVSVGVTILSYAFFQLWLKVQFPKGIFGI
jgi:hypothetical protein